MTLRDIIAGSDIATRRAFLGGLARSTLGVSTAAMFGPEALAATLQGSARPQEPDGQVVLNRATAKHVIYLFMSGGMSHIDTFDPKPGKATQGPIQAIATRADGIQVSQYFPRLADQMDKVCVINSMSSRQGAHEQARYVMRTSYEMRGTIQHASLGAWHHRLAGRLNETLPGHVIIGGGADMPSAGYFPPQYQALPIGSADAGLQNANLPGGVSEDRFLRRLKRLEQLNDSFEARHEHRAVKAYHDAYADAVKLMRSSDLAAFDIGLESATVSAAYGDTSFGKGCLLARRLVEHGVRFVEVVTGGWDTHANNFDTLETRCPEIDQGLAALLADLDGRGLLRETLVVLCTEFGRTPDIDQDQGRNHYPKAFSALLAGGGVAGGQRFGKTDAEGRDVVDDPVSVQDFNATIAHACGIPTDHVVMSPSGRPFKVADKGSAVTSIFS
ncbi:MAG: DUF1501 domain-containing protein [Planctomycetes bacterium]|nr:DUF1501 domain-containing protein [Planctomycetota bacterium]